MEDMDCADGRRTDDRMSFQLEDQGGQARL